MDLPKDFFKLRRQKKLLNKSFLEICQSGDYQAVYSRLRDSTRPLDINYRDPDGYTALYYALDSGNEHVVNEIVQHGADTTIRYRDGITCLHLAASTGDTDIISLFLFGSGYTDYGPDGDATGISAEEYKALNIIHPTDVNTLTVRGLTPLHFAAETNPEAIKFLLKNKANINAWYLNWRNEKITALRYAVSIARFNVVKELIHSKAICYLPEVLYNAESVEVYNGWVSQRDRYIKRLNGLLSKKYSGTELILYICQELNKVPKVDIELSHGDLEDSDYELESDDSDYEEVKDMVLKAKTSRLLDGVNTEVLSDSVMLKMLSGVSVRKKRVKP